MERRHKSSLLRLLSIMSILLFLSSTPSFSMESEQHGPRNLREGKLVKMTSTEFKEGEQEVKMPLELGGHTLRIKCIGTQSPTIVLESGLGCPGSLLSGVAEEISKFSRVCFYDRAGYGKSERGPLPRSVEQIAKELNTLLLRAKIPRPYVLVGHSMGGLVARVFERKFPNEVVGIVLVDATHEQSFEAGPLTFNLNSKVGDFFINESKAELPEAYYEERNALQDSLRNLQEEKQIGNKPLGNKALPVIQAGKEEELGYVLTRRNDILKCMTSLEQKEFTYFLDNFSKMSSIKEIHQRELSQLSHNGRLVTASDCGHATVIQSNLLIDELKQLVEKVRNE